MRSAIITAAHKFDNAVRNTVVESAIEVANAVTDEWEVMDAETAGDIAAAIVKDYPAGSQAARKSEWKAFIMAAHCKLDTAIRYAKTNVPNFGRVDLFKLCRILPKADNYKAAVEDLAKQKKAKKTASKGATRATLANGLSTIKNVDTPPKGVTKAKLNEFRRKLAALCEEYGIAY